MGKSHGWHTVPYIAPDGEKRKLRGATLSSYVNHVEAIQDALSRLTVEQQKLLLTAYMLGQNDYVEQLTPIWEVSPELFMPNGEIANITFEVAFAMAEWHEEFGEEDERGFVQATRSFVGLTQSPWQDDAPETPEK